MNKITYEFQIGKYRVLKIEPFTSSPYKKVKIGNMLFITVPTYDMPNCIALEFNGEEKFLNKSIEFI